MSKARTHKYARISTQKFAWEKLLGIAVFVPLSGRVLFGGHPRPPALTQTHTRDVSTMCSLSCQMSTLTAQVGVLDFEDFRVQFLIPNLFRGCGFKSFSFSYGHVAHIPSPTSVNARQAQLTRLTTQRCTNKRVSQLVRDASRNECKKSIGMHFALFGDRIVHVFLSQIAFRNFGGANGTNGLYRIADYHVN